MSVPLDLLRDTKGRAVGFATYGSNGLEKTRAIRTLPPPVLCLEFEGGTGSLTAWTRRSRRSDSAWKDFTQEEREHAFSLFREDYRKAETVEPAPVVDSIYFDPMSTESYSHFTAELGNFNTHKYNSLAIDAALEFSQMTQSFAKGQKGLTALDPMELKLWGGAQERAFISVKMIRGFRDSGVFIYITGGEIIEKEYVQDPRAMNLAPGEKPPQPYAMAGTIQVPGQLSGIITDSVDNLFHARTVNGAPAWVCEREAINNDASWNAKDRWGRLDKFSKPSFYSIFAKLYGKEGARAIYEYARTNADQARA